MNHLSKTGGATRRGLRKIIGPLMDQYATKAARRETQRSRLVYRAMVDYWLGQQAVMIRQATQGAGVFEEIEGLYVARPVAISPHTSRLQSAGPRRGSPSQMNDWLYPIATRLIKL
jgi:hypothetical protein